jgi:dephospho-CoA kinase
MHKLHNRFLVIGLTGGIACGKSTVARLFKRMGAAGIDADRIVRELYRPGTMINRRLAAAFGAGVVRKNGSIDRKKLGGIVFRDQRRRKILERLTHPAIVREIRRQISVLRRAGKKRVVVVEAPLLFEARAEHLVDCTVVVTAPRRAQLERLMIARRLRAGDARPRIAAHGDERRKQQRADYCIANTAGIQQLEDNARHLWGVLTKTKK